MPRPGRNTIRRATHRERTAGGGVSNESNGQQISENVSASRRRNARRRINREGESGGGANKEPNRQQTNENVSARGRRRNTRRRTNRVRAAECGAATESARECNNQQKIEYEKHDFEALYWETETALRFQSMKIVAFLIIVLYVIANFLPNVSPGTVDGLQAVLSGFLSAVYQFERSTRLKGRRNEKYNSYFFQNLFFICVGSLFAIQKKKALETDGLTWKQTKTMSIFFGGYIGSDLMKENELMGGIMGSFIGLMGADVFKKPTNM